MARDMRVVAAHNANIVFGLKSSDLEMRSCTGAVLAEAYAEVDEQNDSNIHEPVPFIKGVHQLM